MSGLDNSKGIPREIIDLYAKEYCKSFDLDKATDSEGQISLEALSRDFRHMDLVKLHDAISENMLADLKLLQSEVLRLYWEHSRVLDALGQRAARVPKREEERSKLLTETDVSLSKLLTDSLALHNRFDRIRYHLAILQGEERIDRTSEVKVLAGVKVDFSQIEGDFEHIQKIIIEHEDLKRQTYMEHVFSMPQIDSISEAYEDVFMKSKGLADALFGLMGVGFTFYVKVDDRFFESFYAYGRRPDDPGFPIDLREDGAIHRAIKNTFSLSEVPASSVEFGVFVESQHIGDLSSGPVGVYLSRSGGTDEIIERALAYEMGPRDGASIESLSMEFASYLENYDRNLSKVPSRFNLSCFLNINLWCADSVDTAGADFIFYFTKLVSAIHRKIQQCASGGRGGVDIEKYKRFTSLVRFANADSQVKSLYDKVFKRLKLPVMVPIAQFSPFKLDAYAEALGKVPRIKWQSAILEPRGREVIGGIQCIDETGKWGFNPLVVKTKDGTRVEIETYNFLKGLQVFFSSFMDGVYKLRKR